MIRRFCCPIQDEEDEWADYEEEDVEETLDDIIKLAADGDDGEDATKAATEATATAASEMCVPKRQTQLPDSACMQCHKNCCGASLYEREGGVEGGGCEILHPCYSV